jgi:hypothetical protein
MTSQITIPTIPRIIPTISPISNIRWYFGIAMRVIVVLTPIATLAGTIQSIESTRGYNNHVQS